MDPSNTNVVNGGTNETLFEKVARLRIELYQAECELAKLLGTSVYDVMNYNMNMIFNLPNGLNVSTSFGGMATMEQLVSWLKEIMMVKGRVAILDPEQNLVFNYIPSWTLRQLGFKDGHTYNVYILP